MSSHKCTGKCNIQGFLVEYCLTCGWEDNYAGDGTDPYEQSKHTKQITMIKERRHHCHACAYLRLGVKPQIMPMHTCETIPPIKVSNMPENAVKIPETDAFLQENDAQNIIIADPISLEILNSSGFDL